MARTKHNPHTFDSLNALLGAKNAKKIEHNTYAVREDANTIHVKFHNTYILSFFNDTAKSIRIYSGGWRTPTTKNRINQFLPLGYYVHQTNHEWLFAQYLGNGVHKAVCPFEEKMSIQTVKA